MNKSYTENPKPSDDIDLLAIIKSVLSTWKICLLFMVLVSAAYLAVKSATILAITPEQIYQKPIRLTFPGAHELTFPNGSPFQYSDIVSPAVAQRVYERNNLKELGISAAEFQRELTSFPFSPQYPLIYESYVRKMSDKKLTPDQIDKIREQMTAELKQASQGEAIISWRIKHINITKEVANRVLNDIPAVWADLNIKDRGVLSLNSPISTTQSLNLDDISNKDFLIAGDMIEEKLNLLLKNIEALDNFKSSKMIVDRESGMNLTDLVNAISDLRVYDLGSFIAPYKLNGISNSPDLTQYYFQDKLHKLQSKLSSLTYMSGSIRDILRGYSGNNLSAKDSYAENTSAAIAPQITGDLIDKLAKLSGNAEKEIYIQELNERWLDIESEISKLQITFSDTQITLEGLNKNAQNSSNNTALFEIGQKMQPVIVNKLSSYYQIFHRIALQLENEVNGSLDNLYIPITNGVIEEKNIINIKEIILYWIILMILTVIIVIPTTLIARAVKNKE